MIESDLLDGDTAEEASASVGTRIALFLALSVMVYGSFAGLVVGLIEGLPPSSRDSWAAVNRSSSSSTSSPSYYSSSSSAAVSPTSAPSSTAAAMGGTSPTAALTSTLVFIAAGQSNMVGWSNDGVPFGASTPYANPHVTQLAMNLQVIPAVDPLQYPQQGPGHSQAIPLGYNTWLNTGRNVTLIPCAWAGTGFTGIPNWVPVNMSDPASASNPSFLYYNCTSRANYLLSQPGYVLGGIFWDQGETEAQDSTPGVVWLSDVDNLVASWRRDLIGGTNVPFVAVQMVPSWVATSGGTAIQVQAALNSIPYNISRSAVVYGLNSSGNSLLYGDGGPIHYSAVSQQILGFADYYAWAAAQNNYAGSTTPGPIVQVFIGLSPGQFNLSWTPDPIATSYRVQLSNGVITSPTSPNTTLTGLSSCSPYVVNVAGIGPTGTLGAPWVSSTITTLGC